MASIEAAIDELYQGPLGGFVAARTALARTLKGADAARIKALAKPTTVPWAVNQVYWHARPVYERVSQSGAALRSAQVAALKGHASDLREANAAHRKAIADAVAEASRLGSRAGVHPNIDQLSRTFEALSLQKAPPVEPGRLVTIPAPSGFEALSGIAIAAPKSRDQPPPTKQRAEPKRPPAAASTTIVRLVPKGAPGSTRSAARAGKKAAREQARRAAELTKADAAVRRAEAAERRAHRAWETAKSALERAVQARALAALRAPAVE